MATADVSSRGAQVIAWSYATFAAASFFVILRLFVRWKLVGLLGKEDGCIIAALVAALLTSVFMNLEVTHGGLGLRWNTLSSDNIEEFFKFSYFSILFYNISLCLTKFGILFLCIRVFGPSKWQKACYAVLVIISIYSLWVIINSIIPCHPIPRYWDKSINGWCFPNAVLWFLNASLNIFTDFLIVLLPVPGIIQLQLPRKQKLGVSCVFTLGFFVCIISIVRLHALYLGSVTTDPTYDNFNIAIWSVLEVNGAIIGACLPTLKPLVSRLWPSLLSSGHSHPSRNTHSYYRHGTGTDGTYHDRRHELRRQGLADGEISPDSGSAAEILRDGVVLSDLDNKKGGVVRTESSEEDDRVGDRVHVSGRQASSDSWSGRSDERPVYGIKVTSDIRLDYGKAS